MNCFHFSVSLGYKTTINMDGLSPTSLWIAFIFQYLWDTKQQIVKQSKAEKSCELLSFFSIFGIQNNKTQISHKEPKVVNCFHFSVSLGYKTTVLLKICCLFMLWIAFIFQYLWDTKQQVNDKVEIQFGCELLSFFSIFGIQNNDYVDNETQDAVVNCFHFSVSLGYKTTLSFDSSIEG